MPLLIRLKFYNRPLSPAKGKFFTLLQQRIIVRNMSVILEDLMDEKHDLQLNNWNWQPIVELIKHSPACIDKERLEMLEAKMVVEVSQQEARIIASYLETFVGTLKKEEIVKQDLSIQPKTPGPRPLDNITPEQWDNLYETNAEVLQNLITFCKTCSGFRTF